MIRPTLRQLAYLVALEEEKSFSLAAKYCLVTQSTLSAGIMELERILEQPLVNRSGHSISLTPFGMEVYVIGRKILCDADSIMARSKQMRAPLSGPLRIGVIPTIAPYLLPQILPKLQSEFPELEIQLYEDITKRLLDLSDQGRLDVLLMAFPYTTPGMIQKILFEESFVLASPKNRPLPKKLLIQDLNGEDLLLLEDGHCLREHALSACNFSQSNKRKTFSATSLPTLIQMVQHNYGITLLPSMAISETQLPDNIRLTYFVEGYPTRQIGLAWNDGSPFKKGLDLLYNYLKKLLKNR